MSNSDAPDAGGTESAAITGFTREEDSMQTLRLPPQARVTSAGRVTAPHYVIWEFDHRCRHCGWEGPGKDLRTGEVHEGSGIVDYDCPKCGEWIALSYPTPETDERVLKEYEAFLASVPVVDPPRD